MLRMLLWGAALLYMPLSHAADNRVLLLFGDSIVAGYNLPPEDMPSVSLEQRLVEQGSVYQEVVNGGVSGDTTFSGRARFAWTLDTHSPKGVLIALGGNDILRGLPPEIIVENLETMVKEALSRDMIVYLSAVTPPSNMGEAYGNVLTQGYASLVETYDVVPTPFLLEPVFGKAEYMQGDGIHPNAIGVGIITDMLTRIITDSAGKPAA